MVASRTERAVGADNSIRIVCLFDHHKWVINVTVLVINKPRSSSATFGEALEIGHLALHLFAGGVEAERYALNAQL